MLLIGAMVSALAAFNFRALVKKESDTAARGEKELEAQKYALDAERFRSAVVAGRSVTAAGNTIAAGRVDCWTSPAAQRRRRQPRIVGVARPLANTPFKRGTEAA